MKIENIRRFYELDADRILLRRLVDALEKEGEEPYITINTMDEGSMRLPIECAIELRSIVKVKLSEVERKILSL